MSLLQNTNNVDLSAILYACMTPEPERRSDPPPDEFADITGFAEQYINAARRARTARDEKGIVPDQILSEFLPFPVVNPCAQPRQVTRSIEISKAEKAGRRLTYEEVKEILGEDFIGPLELGKMVSYLRERDVPSTALWYYAEQPIFEDVQHAKEHGELAVLVPSHIGFGRAKISLNLHNLTSLAPELFDDPWWSDQRFAWRGASEQPSKLLYIAKEPLEGSFAAGSEDKLQKLEEYKTWLSGKEIPKNRARLLTITELALIMMIKTATDSVPSFPVHPAISASITDDGQRLYARPLPDIKIGIYRTSSGTPVNTGVYPCR